MGVKGDRRLHTSAVVFRHCIVVIGTVTHRTSLQPYGRRVPLLSVRPTVDRLAHTHREDILRPLVCLLTEMANDKQPADSQLEDYKKSVKVMFIIVLRVLPRVSYTTVKDIQNVYHQLQTVSTPYVCNYNSLL